MNTILARLFFPSPANTSNKKYKANISVSEILSPAFAPTDVQTGSCGDLWWCNTNAHMFGPQNQIIVNVNLIIYHSWYDKKKVYFLTLHEDVKIRKL